MDLAIILAAVGLVASVVVPIVLSRREHPKRELAYEFEAESLLAVNASRINLTVMHDGRLVLQPYLATLTVTATGRADIASTTFDAGKPITFTSNRPIIAEFDSNRGHQSASIQLAREGSNSLALQPALIKKGDRAVRRFLVDGEPSMVATSSLIDTELVDSEKLARRARVASYALRIGIPIAFLFAGLIVALVFPAENGVAGALSSLGTGVLVGAVAAAVAAVASLSRHRSS